MFKIIIRDIPFVEILRSAYETLNVECNGFLFGERFKHRGDLTFLIEEAHPIQLARRYPAKVYLDNNQKNNLAFLYKKIGEYHSHVNRRTKQNGISEITKSRAVLSEPDRNSLKERFREIEIVLALRKVEKTPKLIENHYLASGYIKDKGLNYRFDIGGYTLIEGTCRRGIIEAPAGLMKKLR